MWRLQIAHGKSKWNPTRRAYEGAMQWLHVLAALGPGLGHQFLHCLTHFERTGRRRQWFAVIDGDRMRNAMGKFPNEFAAFETEQTAPYTVERHWNDRRGLVLHDALEAAAEREQLSNPGDLAFCKDANDFTILDRLA